ncbi:MAG: SHOCT domain-containing protein [Ktedonobacteraceae bacterium]
MPGFDRGFDFGPGPGFMGIIPLIGTILWFALLAMLVIALIRWLTARDTPPMFWYRTAPPPPMHHPPALEILRQRYARGEIDDATFQQMRERLEASTPPGPQHL